MDLMIQIYEFEGKEVIKLEDLNLFLQHRLEEERKMKGVHQVAFIKGEISFIEELLRGTCKLNKHIFFEKVIKLNKIYYDSCGIAIEHKEKGKSYCNECHIEIPGKEFINQGGLCYECREKLLKTEIEKEEAKNGRNNERKD